MKRVADRLDEIVEETSIPSLSLCVYKDGREWLHHTAGMARLDPPTPAIDEQIYDLASLTKILAATPVAATLVDRGVLSLDSPVAEHLPDVDPRITLAHLMSHSSGLPAWQPLYATVPQEEWGSEAARAGILARARTAALESVPGEAHRYSDLGFLTLLDLFEKASGERFEELVSRFHALAGVELSWGSPAAAATQQCAVRGQVVQGEVDDLNCAALGGVSTHAGLFGTAREVARLVHHLAEGVRAGGSLGAFASYRGPGSHRLGFDSISPGYSSTGGYFPGDTIGHLGFTGTSAWVSPSRGVAVVLLSNRVHPEDRREDIRAARPAIHDAVATALGWATVSP